MSRVTPRQRLAELLIALGYTSNDWLYPLSEYDIVGVKGANRTLAKYDDTILTWEADLRPPGFESDSISSFGSVHVVSWDTMTACARHGVSINDDDPFVHYVTANHPDRAGKDR